MADVATKNVKFRVHILENPTPHKNALVIQWKVKALRRLNTKEVLQNLKRICLGVRYKNGEMTILFTRGNVYSFLVINKGDIYSSGGSKKKLVQSPKSHSPKVKKASCILIFEKRDQLYLGSGRFHSSDSVFSACSFSFRGFRKV